MINSFLGRLESVIQYDERPVLRVPKEHEMNKIYWNQTSGYQLIDGLNPLLTDAVLARKEAKAFRLPDRSNTLKSVNIKGKLLIWRACGEENGFARDHLANGDDGVFPAEHARIADEPIQKFNQYSELRKKPN